MTTFKKIMGTAVSALLVSAPVAATAAQPVRPSAALVAGESKAVKAGIRTSSVKRGGSAAEGSSFVLAGVGALVFIAGVWVLVDDDDNDSPD